ncbi:hypothetical protein [Hippea alviniae]|uniref:hypothetical protein n=1 Tax=Hippea alviniae TaxID=1279027 RepID=UPI0003B4D0EC|nr:hypothetical protein [Hippea alviniae]
MSEPEHRQDRQDIQNALDRDDKVFIIFDIETIVEEDLFNKAAKRNQIKRYMDEEDEYIPSAVYHKPICLSYLLTTSKDVPIFKNGKRFVFKSIFSLNAVNIVNEFFGLLRYTTKWINKKFENLYAEPLFSYPFLVSHNGLKFDLPILTMRAIQHYDSLSKEAKEGLRKYLDDSDKWEKEKANYTKQYSTYQIDTYNFFRTNLKALAILYGFEAKTFMDGSEVKEYYENMRFNEIAKYCAEDVLNLAKIFNKLLIAKEGKNIAVPERIDECEIIVNDSR